MKKLQRQDGFTLIEVIVVAGIIAVLAGILVPLIFKEIDEARITRANADLKSISTSLLVYRKDTGQWPTYDNTCAAVVTYYVSGTEPTGFPMGNWDNTSGNGFDYFMNQDGSGCFGARWKGPYMAVVGSDPWGKGYLLDAKSLAAATGPVWLISAGPDGTLQTDSNATALAGDDIGLRIR